MAPILIAALLALLVPAAADLPCEANGNLTSTGLPDDCDCNPGFVGVNCSVVPMQLTAGVASSLTLTEAREAKYFKLAAAEFLFGRSQSLTVNATAQCGEEVTVALVSICGSRPLPTFILPQPSVRPPLLPPAYQQTFNASSMDESVTYAWGDVQNGELPPVVPPQVPCPDDTQLVGIVYSNDPAPTGCTVTMLPSAESTDAICDGNGVEGAMVADFTTGERTCNCTASSGKLGSYCSADAAVTLPVNETGPLVELRANEPAQYLTWTTNGLVGTQYLEITLENEAECDLTTDMLARIGISFTCGQSRCQPKELLWRHFKQSPTGNYSRLTNLLPSQFMLHEVTSFLPLDGGLLTLLEDFAFSDSWGCGCSQFDDAPLTWYLAIGSTLRSDQVQAGQAPTARCDLRVSLSHRPALCSGLGTPSGSDINSKTFECDCLPGFNGTFCNGQLADGSTDAPDAAGLGWGAILFIIVCILYVFLAVWYLYDRKMNPRPARSSGDDTALEMPGREIGDDKL